MIKISNLSKSFSGQTVLDHLNLDIQKGEVVALIGSSGAGKSNPDRLDWCCFACNCHSFLVSLCH